MSDLLGKPTRPGRRALALSAALGGVLLLLGGGTLFRPEPPAFNGNRAPLVGRTTTICTTSAPRKGEPSGKTEVAAVAIREGSDRSGLLTGSTLSSKPAGLKITQQGKGAQLSPVNSPIVISGEGAMATANSAVIIGDVMEGQEAGLKAAPCLTPGTLQWFSGLGTTDEDRTELILTNPDDTQAQVDLRFYGPRGRIAVPGSPGPRHPGAPVRTPPTERPGASRRTAERRRAGDSRTGDRSCQAGPKRTVQARRSRLADPLGPTKSSCRHPGRTRGCRQTPAGRHQSR
jgi:hypothetical protein